MDGSTKLVSPSNLSKLSGSWAENFNNIAAGAASQVIFTAPYSVRFLGAYLRAGTAATAGGTMQIEHTPNGTACGSGTALLVAGAIPTTAPANTIKTAALAALSAASFVIPAGDSISIVPGANTTLANCTVTIILQKA